MDAARQRLITAWLVAFACGFPGCDTAEGPAARPLPFGDETPAPAPPPDGIKLSHADARLIGEAESDHAGRAVAFAGDVDGDGFDDILVGAPNVSEVAYMGGAAYLVCGPVYGDRDLADADARFLGDVNYLHVGSDVAGAGDLDGDGLDDVFVAANRQYEAGDVQAFALLGPLSGDRMATDADTVFTGGGSTRCQGHCLAGLGDVDGDGRGDLALGLSDHTSFNGLPSSAVYLWLASAADEVPLTDPTPLPHASDYDRSGWAVAPAGDTDGDGQIELIVGAPTTGYPGGGNNTGAAILARPTVADGDPSLEWMAIFHEREVHDDYLGSDVAGAGDVNGDGFDDVLVVAGNGYNGDARVGLTYLLYGPLSGYYYTDSLPESAALFDGAGGHAAAAGDVDGDGYGDVVMEVPTTVGDRRGAVGLFRGPLSGWIAASQPDRKLVGERDHDDASRAAGGGDADGDGRHDLLVGAPHADLTQEDQGVVYVVYASSLFP